MENNKNTTPREGEGFDTPQSIPPLSEEQKNPTGYAEVKKLVPTVGRVVYYKAYGTPGGEFPAGVERAAIITDVRGTPSDVKSPYQVRLCVLNPTGMFFSDWLWQGDQPGQWDWMPFQKGVIR